MPPWYDGAAFECDLVSTQMLTTGVDHEQHGVRDAFGSVHQVVAERTRARVHATTRISRHNTFGRLPNEGVQRGWRR